VGKPERKRPLGRPGGWIILKWILDRIVCHEVDLSDSRWGPMEGPFEHGTEPVGRIKYSEIIEWLSAWRLFKKGSAP
jgi:hypothetical protein